MAENELLNLLAGKKFIAKNNPDRFYHFEDNTWLQFQRDSKTPSEGSIQYYIESNQGGNYLVINHIKQAIELIDNNDNEIRIMEGGLPRDYKC